MADSQGGAGRSGRACWQRRELQRGWMKSHQSSWSYWSYMYTCVVRFWIVWWLHRSCITLDSCIYDMFTYCYSFIPCYGYALVVICPLFVVCMSGPDIILILRCSWCRVSATVGMGLRSSAIVVIDLGRRDYQKLRTVNVLSSHLVLLFVSSLDPVWTWLMLISLTILASSNVMSWLVDREWSDLIDCGRLVRVDHGWVSPMFELSLDSFDLWMCTSSV
jgi:hypothetical protein